MNFKNSKCKVCGKRVRETLDENKNILAYYVHPPWGRIGTDEEYHRPCHTLCADCMKELKERHSAFVRDFKKKVKGKVFRVALMNYLVREMEDNKELDGA